MPQHKKTDIARAQEIIHQLQLTPHPEGGYYKRSYQSQQEITANCLGQNYTGKRHLGTAIYYLLTSDNFSAFHRIKQDETWHFYDGSALELHLISPQGHYTCQTIGIDLAAQQVPQFTVYGGYWFAARTPAHNSFSLVGCTVTPGFNFDDFEMPTRQALCSRYPQHSSIITQLTR